MAKLSDKYVELRKNLTYVAPDALQKDVGVEKLARWQEF
jgi:hypothetical protein